MTSKPMVTFEITFKHVEKGNRDRHGRDRLYARIGHGPRIRLRETPGTDAFAEEYRRAVAQLEAGGVSKPPAETRPPLRPIIPGSFRAWCVSYFDGADWRGLDEETRKQRRRLFDRMWDERIDRDKPEPIMADCPIERVAGIHIEMLRDRCADAPHQANHRLKALSHFFGWAVTKARLKADPTDRVKRLKTKDTGGHHTWTREEVERFFQRHGPGTKARLAMTLMMLTGLRVSDLCRVGPQHIRGGWLRLAVHKNRNRKRVEIEIPVLAALTYVIESSTVGNLAFLVTEYGKPFSAKGLSNKIKDWCVDAGLPHCSAHGVRKAGATVAAENGATEAQLMSIFGWTDPKQAAIYTRAARRKVLAASAINLLLPAQGENEIPHLFGGVGSSEGITAEKDRKINER